MNELERIKARTIDDGGCWIWTGANNGAGHPKLHNCSARRKVWSLTKDNKPQRNHVVSVTCGSPLCLNPDHLVCRTKAEVSRISNAKPSVKLRRSAASARTNRPTMGKITMEIAREIRSSDKQGKDWAKELGVSVSLVSHVRRGKSWVDHSNPFMALMA